MEINQRIFWKNVRKMRERKGWSQQIMSEKIGMNVKNYNTKERGFSSKLPIDLAEQIAKALNTTVSLLLDGEEPEESLINPEYENFWNNVKSRREKLNLSQADVAEMLGMSPQNYQAKESCRAAKLPAELAQQVADVLDCSVDELMTMKVEQSTKRYTEEIVANNSEYDISHLPEGVAKFLSDKNNEKIIISMVVDHLMKATMNS